MQGARTSKTDQRKIPRVVTLFHRYQAQRTVHILVNNIDDAGRRALDGDAQGVCHRLDRFLGKIPADLHITPEAHLAGEISQYHVGVSHCG